MKIGELSAASDTSVQTIRYYEREKLLPTPARSNNNYRAYGPAHLETLLFIRYGRKLGMSLAELRTLLKFRASPEEGCQQINALLDHQISEVTQRLEDLKQLKQQLMDLRNRCAGNAALEPCGILHELSRVASETAQAQEYLHDMP